MTSTAHATHAQMSLSRDTQQGLALLPPGGQWALAWLLPGSGGRRPCSLLRPPPHLPSEAGGFPSC